jgi:hypothetical protein
MPNTPQPWINAATNAVNPTKNALIVEGPDDHAVMQEWLRKEPILLWSDKVHLAEVGGRAALLKGLKWLHDENAEDREKIFGLADRDEWDAADVLNVKAERPTLLVNEDRHSIESYFCDPAELLPALRAWHDSGEFDFSKVISALPARCEAQLATRVPHWALCRVIGRRARQISLDARYPHFFRDQCPLPAEATIREKLQEWATLFDPDAVYVEYEALRDASLAKSLSQQYRGCVEPASFFTQVIKAGTDGLNAVKLQDDRQWMIELARWSPEMPADLRALLQPVLQ